MQSGTEKRAALAYARAVGWLPPEECSVAGNPEAAVRVPAGHFVFTEDPRPALEAKVADLETALAAERESHQVTKKALERARRKGRVGELEAAARDLIDSIRFVGPVTGQPPMNEAEVLAIAAAEALLK